MVIPAGWGLALALAATVYGTTPELDAPTSAAPDEGPVAPARTAEPPPTIEPAPAVEPTPTPSSASSSASPSARAVARRPRGEVLLDATAAPRPPDRAVLPVHGEARLGLGFGAVMQDIVAVVHPSVELDLSEVAPVWIRVGAPIRFRMIERAPDQSGVVRRRDWDEVGDGLAVLERIDYHDEFALARPGHAAISVHGGRLRGTTLGHGSILRGYDNSLDVDRRRTGVDARTEVVGELLGKPAELDATAIVGDLSGMQVLGGRVGTRWAGAGLAFTAVGDPTAPQGIARPPGADDRFARGRAGVLRTEGARGVSALGLELSYEATDGWRWRVEPYVDLVLMPGLARGLHVGADGDVVLGRRRRMRLGAFAELTVGDSAYAPGYFDVFYLAERWQFPLVATPEDRPDDLVDIAAPKVAYVQREDLFGAGGWGGVRFSHESGAFAQVDYQARPGPNGHTFALRTGLDLRPVALSLLVAHRGRHGFQPRRVGSLAEIDLRVPVIRWVDVFAGLGWTFAIRADETAPPGGEDTGLVTGAGFFVAGVGGRVPW